MGNGLDAVDSLSSAGYDRLAFQLSSFSWGWFIFDLRMVGS